MKKNNNITLIGMPGTGKGSIGRKLAKKLKYIFVDIDKIVESENEKSLNSICHIYGENKVIELEEQSILNLGPVKNHVISPGSSIIYSRPAVNWLKENSTIVYIETSIENLTKRIYSLNKRGIPGLKEKKLTGLFKECCPVYQEYSDITINIEDIPSISLVINKLSDIILSTQ
ncbi:MAG: shikimate kinase [bacterium]|nr:shikimate kinase [bacterium]